MNNPSESENPDPDSTQHKSPQFQNPISFDPQTLEFSSIQNPKKPDPTRLIADQEEEKELSGMVLESATKLPNRRNFSKRKKAVVYKKQLAIDKKVQNLLQLGTLIPFVPSKRFDFDMHEALFKRLGLWDFVHVEFDEVIRDDLVGQFIVSYDHVKKCCFVNGFRISVNRSRFATVMKLPVKKDKGVGNVAEAVIDLEVGQVSEECVEFVHDFVWSWVVLRGSDWVTPNEIKGWMGLIRDGNLEKVDWASLIWVMVENELKQKDQLRMCYYASHLQYFIKSQRKDLFDEESEDVAGKEEMKEGEKALGEEEINEVNVEEMKKDEDLLEEAEKVDEKEVMDDRDLLRGRPQEVDEKEAKKGLHEAEVEEVEEGPHEEAVEVEGVKKDVFGSFYELGKDPDKFVMEEPNTGLTLGQQDIVQKEEIKDDTRMSGEECLEKKYDNQFYFGHDTESKHFLKPCLFGEGRSLNGKEEIKQEVGQLETKEEEHMEEGEGIQEWEHMEAEDLEELEGDEMREQLEMEDEEEEELEDEEDEELEDDIDCNIAPTYGSVERANLTGNLFQGFEPAHLPLNLQGQQLHENPSMARFASNVEKQVMMDAHKRVFDYEQDTSHPDGSKRIRTDVDWDQNTSDFRSCMDQARQYMEKAKLIYEEKGQAYNQVNANRQYLLQELQQRNNVIENLQREKNEELQKKDREIYRLERELDLLGELVNGYREALKVNRNMFFEYRQRCKLPEEPIYKDVGSGGGLVLSTTDLEKQRQQQENEDRLKRLMIEQKYKEALEGYINQFQVLFSKVQTIDVNRLTPLVNEVKLLKELYAARHKAPKIPDCVPPESTLPSA
ncbi:hypothetical protein POM88_030348 [Heracleum sosnowskyi]|uniref:Uncharacterized protein n=1 Tax=Heracleum sosnowskyi TaxID=360622 RepID=A0AAD8HYD9_9APIA|nr:hypothetical protein POM88_030348 [Heracleum sosnowskyi]